MATRAELPSNPSRDPSAALDIVLPTCLALPTREFLDVDRACILCRSLERFLDPADRWTVHVLVADTEADQIRARLSPDRLDFRFHCHSELLPELNTAWCWRRQQLLKLAAAQRIAGKFCLVLDSDQILTRRLAVSDLVRDGRAMITPESRHVHAAWWTGSAAILGTRPVDDPAITPSCVCLSTALVRGLLDRLVSRLGTAWFTALLGRDDWTEYCLYYTYAQAQGEASHYHFPGELLSTAHSVWFSEQIETWDADKAFAGEHYFICIQSRTNIPPEMVRELTARYLEF